MIQNSSHTRRSGLCAFFFVSLYRVRLFVDSTFSRAIILANTSNGNRAALTAAYRYRSQTLTSTALLHSIHCTSIVSKSILICPSLPKDPNHLRATNSTSALIHINNIFLSSCAPSPMICSYKKKRVLLLSIPPDSCIHLYDLGVAAISTTALDC